MKAKKFNSLLKENQLLTKSEKLFLNFWVFILASVIGTLVEIIFHLIKAGNFENRSGLIYGISNPVYGFGALLMSLIFEKIKNKNNINIFFSCMIIGTIFEYFCSFFQEITLHSVSWEYSKKLFNINGRINLLYSFFWGFLGLFWINGIYKKMKNSITLFYTKINILISFVFALLLMSDMGISFIAIFRYSQKIQGIPAKNKIEKFIDSKYTESVIKERYPNIIFINN